jgi:hypothetical protein
MNGYKARDDRTHAWMLMRNSWTTVKVSFDARLCEHLRKVQDQYLHPGVAHEVSRSVLVDRKPGTSYLLTLQRLASYLALL